MSSKLSTGSIVFAACLLLFFAGCESETETGSKSIVSGKTADVQMVFTVGTSAKYKVTTERFKKFKFEQPSLNKLKKEQTGSKIETTFTQTVDSVDTEGNAVLSIRIDGLKYFAENKGGVVLDFDSAADTEHGLAKLIGRSYRITMSPLGAATSFDISSARAVSGNKFVRSYLADKNIQQRHQILALPDASNTKLKAGQSWSAVKSPPPGMLAPKNFEKTYTLDSVRGNTAEIAMMAVPTSKKAKISASVKSDSGMGILGKMFDAEDKWNGNLVLDLGSGMVNKYNETFISTYIAAEESRFQVEGKGPDMLTMGLINSVSLEKID